MADEPKQKSAILVEFEAPGSVVYNVQPIGVVTVGQLEVLAHDLLSQAQYARYAQIHQAALAQQAEKDRPKIIVPNITAMKPS